MVRDASTLIYSNVVTMLKKSETQEARSRAETNDMLPPPATSTAPPPAHSPQQTHSFSVLPRSAGSSSSTFEAGSGSGGGCVASLHSCSAACVARERLSQNFYESAIEQLVRRAQLIDGRALHLSCELNALKTHISTLQQQKKSLAVGVCFAPYQMALRCRISLSFGHNCTVFVGSADSRTNFCLH